VTLCGLMVKKSVAVEIIIDGEMEVPAATGG
jgi:hypothetical protein